MLPLSHQLQLNSELNKAIRLGFPYCVQRRKYRIQDSKFTSDSQQSLSKKPHKKMSALPLTHTSQQEIIKGKSKLRV